MDHVQSLEPPASAPDLQLADSSPLVHAPEFGKRYGVELYIKDEGALGGNHARKVPGLLEHAAARGAKTVLSFGGVGSNWIVTLAQHARRHGLGCEAILVDQPNTPWVRRNLLLMRHYGARIHHVPTYNNEDPRAKTILNRLAGEANLWTSIDWHARVYFRAGLATYRLVRRVTQRDGTYPYIIPPGGSTARGALGFARVGFELAEQIQAGKLATPSAVFIATSSCGSMAGLLAGLAHAGVRVPVYGVKVAESYVTNSINIRRLARKASKALGAHNAEPGPFSLLGNYLGARYGAVTEDAVRGVTLARELAELELDTTYTGKAFAALVDWVTTAKRPAASAPVLFVNTLGRTSPPTGDDNFPVDMAQSLRPYFGV